MKYKFNKKAIKRLKEQKIFTRDCFNMLIKVVNDVEIPDGVEELFDCAFKYCVNLKEVKLPSTLKVIGSFAFADCTSLERIEIPKGVETISRDAFKDCVNLNEIRIPTDCENLKFCVNIKPIKSLTIGDDGFLALGREVNSILHLTCCKSY